MNGIPILTAEGDGIAETWENALMLLYHSGCSMKTPSDPAGEPPGKDATMIVTIHDPLSEPMIHRDFSGGFESLQEYVMDFCEGVKDHRIRNPDDPDDTRLPYTNHERLFGYQVPTQVPVDQIERICAQLAVKPTCQNAQAITWKVWEDSSLDQSPGLQSVWCRISRDDEHRFLLNMNVRFRAIDAYNEAFLLWFALMQLQKKMAIRIHELSGKPIELGRCCHMIDSFYIPGSSLGEFSMRFLLAMHSRTFEQRTMRYETIRDIMESARPIILENIRRGKR